MPINQITRSYNPSIAESEGLQASSSEGLSFAHSLIEAESKSTADSKAGNGTRTILGVLDEQNPTVSHLLHSSSLYKSRVWEIVYAEANKQKDYTKMLPGTEVAIDDTTGELFWKDGSIDVNTNQNHHTPKAHNTRPTGLQALRDSSQLKDLGVISKQQPTVSHLLARQKKTLGNFWNIIDAPINAQKNFRSLRPNTQVLLNPQTNEIVFRKPPTRQAISSYAKVQASMTLPKEQHSLDLPSSFSAQLADAVKPYIGRPYDEIDCYGLVVRGLMRQGINYQGKNGLRQTLEHEAQEIGLPPNAFLNGEGLIQRTGTTVYSKTYLSVEHPDTVAHTIYNSIVDKLEPGLILSFSTQSRGHTGIISKNGQTWTYLNSGLMDNELGKQGHARRMVGEEILANEIQNWCRLAQNRGEQLSITVGRLEENKLKEFAAAQALPASSRI